MTKRNAAEDLQIHGLLLDDDRQEWRRANYKALRHWYAALANREFAPCNVVFLGDSVTTGGFVGAVNRKFTRLFTDGIQRGYKPGGAGFIHTREWATEWQFAAGVTNIDAFGYGVAGWCVQMTGTTQTATLTQYTDRVEIYFVTGSNLGVAEILIDGVSQGTINTNSAASTTDPIVWTSSPLTLGTHTIVVRPNAAGVNVLLSGAMVYATDYSSGVHVWAAGHSGYTTSDWLALDTTWDMWEVFGPSYMDPDLVVIQLGLNNQWKGITPAQTKADILTLIDRIATMTERASICLLSLWARADTIKRTDATVTSGSAVVTSAGATFEAGVVGMAYEGADFPAGTTVLSRQSATQITMSANATAGGTNRTVTLRYTDGQWQPYRAALREVVRERDVAMFDMYDLGGYVGGVGTTYHRDISTTSGSAVITSPTAYFRPGVDDGSVVSISGAGIQAATKILSVQSTTQATMDKTATATATVPLAMMTNRLDPDLLTYDLLHGSDRGHQWMADELARTIGGVPRQSTIPQGILNNLGEMIKAAGLDTARVVPGVKNVLADQTIATTALTDVTGLSFPIGPNDTLTFEFEVFWQSSATTNGIGFALNGPASPTSLRAEIEIELTAPAAAANTYQKAYVTAYGTTNLTATVDTANADRRATIKGQITAGAVGGTVSLQARSEVTTGGAQVVIKRGSYGVIL